MTDNDSSHSGVAHVDVESDPVQERGAAEVENEAAAENVVEVIKDHEAVEAAPEIESEGQSPITL